MDLKRSLDIHQTPSQAPSRQPNRRGKLAGATPSINSEDVHAAHAGDFFSGNEQLRKRGSGHGEGVDGIWLASSDRCTGAKCLDKILFNPDRQIQAGSQEK